MTTTTLQTTQTIPRQESEIKELSGFAKWIPLVVMSMALMIIILDTTILNVSLRTIIGDLGTDIQKIQWVITAYSLTLSALTITGGRLGDLFGRKKMFVTGAIVFAVGSFITSISHSVGMMIWGEAIIEGIGAAMMLPATSSLLITNYKGRDRQIAFGVWGGIAAGAAALGPIFGGWLTTYYSWRWAFRLNVGVVILLVIGSFLIKEARDVKEKTELDIGGIILSALGLLLVVFGFIESSTYGWWTAKSTFMIGNFAFSLLGNVSIVVFSMIWGLVFLLCFFLWEMYREARGKTPLVSLSLFSNKQFTIGALLMAILSLGQAGISFATPVFLQAVRNLDALHTGLAMLPMSIALFIDSAGSAYLSKYISTKKIIQGGLILNVLGFIALRQAITITASAWALVPGFSLFGLGMGVMISQVSNVTLSAVESDQAGEASGVNSTLRLIGSTLGSAILGAILLTTIGTQLVTGINNSTVIPQEQKPAIALSVAAQSSSIEFGGSTSQSTDSASSPQALSIKNEITTVSHQAIVDGSRATLTYGVIFSILAFILAIWLPIKEDKNRVKPQIIASAH